MAGFCSTIMNSGLLCLVYCGVTVPRNNLAVNEYPDVGSQLMHF